MVSIRQSKNERKVLLEPNLLGKDLLKYQINIKISLSKKVPRDGKEGLFTRGFMIDLHNHTLWSDGELIPAEHVRRAVIAGYTAVALTDHADASNIEHLCRDIVHFTKNMAKIQDEITVLAGLELTHVLPEEIAELTAYARGHGAQIVVVHGETIVEPVRFGTNLAAIQAKVDILAHPGLITEDEVQLARENEVCLEITSKKGHSLTNGHVARLALALSAKLVIDTDAHSHNDMISDETAVRVLLGAGLPEGVIKAVFQNSADLVKKAVSR
jgi:putative hydrolase